jgi:hypothetical protein
MLVNALVAAYGCLTTYLALMLLSYRITTRQYAGWTAVLTASLGLLCAVCGWTTTLYLTAAGTAVMAWMWWHSGGGDGTRRRLRSWARRFPGVRRTASQAV